MSNDAYSAVSVRRSLVHFILGKSATAVIGLALLLGLVRALDREEYGLLIVLLAALEILPLASSLGVYPALNRYVPELRSSGRTKELARFVAAVSLWRLATLAIACGLFYWAAPVFSVVLGFGASISIVEVYAIVIFFEGTARYLDVVFESLLMQGATQVSVLIRNGLRLAGLVYLASQGRVELADWVNVEFVSSAAACLFASLFAYRNLARISRHSMIDPTGVDFRRVRAYAVPSYLAQVLGIVQGPDVIKLIVAKFAGAIQTGAFGFAAAISGMLHRYLPVFLLLGMLRPLFVAHQTKTRDRARLVDHGNLVFKLNVFVLAPVTMLFLVSGESFASWMSGGKFPNAGPYLVAFSLLLVAQTLHMVLGLIALAVEEARASLTGTVFGLLGLAAGLIAYPRFGALSLCAGLILSELIWCAFMYRALCLHGVVFTVDWRGMLKIWGISAAVAWPVWVLLSNEGQLVGGATILLAAAAMGGAYLLATPSLSALHT